MEHRFGRRYLLLFSYLLMAVSGTCAAFATSFSLFCVFRFGCGMALSGLVLNTLSLSKCEVLHIRFDKGLFRELEQTEALTAEQ